MAGRGRHYIDQLTLDSGADQVDLIPAGAGALEYVTVVTYPPSAIDPVVPLPAAGDRYFNTAVKVWRWYDGAVWIPYGGSSAAGASPIVLGAGRIPESTTKRYLYPSYSDQLAQVSPIEMSIPRPGSLTNLFIRHNAPGGNGSSIVYTVEINGVATALSVSLASTGTVASDLVSAVAVVLGDTMRIGVTKAASIGGNVDDIVASVELV